ncbi:MAG: OsmC family protein [Vicinamibacterales bacterium]|nr:OsmC family protein [Vicinamibacterales bacterium]
MSEARTHHVTLSLRSGYQFDAVFPGVDGTPSIHLDEPVPLGEGQGPNAAALLGAAVGNCLAASLLFCLKKSRTEVGGLEAAVDVRIERNPEGRFRIAGITVTLDPTGVDDAAKLTRCEGLFEDFCIVTESVRAGIPVEVTLANRA